MRLFDNGGLSATIGLGKRNSRYVWELFWVIVLSHYLDWPKNHEDPIEARRPH
jgi:hypothetical protein